MQPILSKDSANQGPKEAILRLHLYQNDIQAIHIFIRDILYDIVDQAQAQMFEAFLTYVEISHLACQKWVKWFATILQCHGDALVVRMNMNIKRMVDYMPMRMYGNVCHEFLTTEIYAENGTLAKCRLLEESIDIFKHCIYLIRLITH